MSTIYASIDISDLEKSGKSQMVRRNIFILFLGANLTAARVTLWVKTADATPHHTTTSEHAQTAWCQSYKTLFYVRYVLDPVLYSLFWCNLLKILE